MKKRAGETIRGHTEDMSIEEQLGQLLMLGFRGTTPSQEIIDLIANHHVGGIILFARNIQNSSQLSELTQSLQAIAREAGHRRPLLIAIDQENGIVRRLGQDASIFPGNMALGAIASEQVTYEVARATGRELQALGINMNLAPVVDINNNPANPVIGVRSFGEDPSQVARHAAAALRGYRAAGVIATLKHFPGHGDTAVDSHLALPIIAASLERLEALELVPFRRGIEADAPAVMTAHIYLPAIMPGAALPATLSPTVVRGLLRERLGFKGVIISDCMEMSAITKTVGSERGTLMALQAGHDLVLVSHTYERQKAGLAMLKVALQSGELAPEDVRRAAQRVLQLKERYTTWKQLPAVAAGDASHRQLRDNAYALSTTLLRDREGLIPLRLEPHARILLLSLRSGASSQAEDTYFSQGSLAASIRKRHQHVQTLSTSADPTDDEYSQIVRAAACAASCDVIIMATLNAYLDRRQAQLMSGLLQSGRRIIGIALGIPYDLLAFPQLGTYLVTYEYTRPALAAAVRVLFGESPARGHLPVSLPGLYERGQQGDWCHESAARLHRYFF